MIQQLRDHFLTVGKLEDCLQKLQARKCSYPSDARMTLSNSRCKGGSMESSLDKSLAGIRRISAGQSGRISIPPPRSKEASWPLPLRDLEVERLELG